MRGTRETHNHIHNVEANRGGSLELPDMYGKERRTSVDMGNTEPGDRVGGMAGIVAHIQTIAVRVQVYLFGQQ